MFPIQEEIYIEIINDDFMFRAIGFIEIYDSLLIVCDPFIDPVIHVFSKYDGSHIASGGRRGQGPGEFIHALDFSFDRNTGQLYVFDHSKSAVIKVDIDSLASQNKMVFEEIRLRNDLYPVNAAYHLQDSLFVVIEGTDDIFLRTSDSIISKAPRIIPPHPYKYDTWRMFLSGNSFATTNHKGDKFVLVTNVGGIMYIYSIQENRISLRSTKYFYKPVLERVPPYFNFEESYMGFYALCFSDDMIYTSISGEKMPETHPYNICLFDYEGNPIIRYNTNSPVVRMAVDEVDGSIFVETTKNGEPALGRAILRNEIN
jgi:hypothetical protein